MSTINFANLSEAAERQLEMAARQRLLRLGHRLYKAPREMDWGGYKIAEYEAEADIWRSVTDEGADDYPLRLQDVFDFIAELEQQGLKPTATEEEAELAADRDAAEDEEYAREVAAEQVEGEEED